jgi:hypothetical protein
MHSFRFSGRRSGILAVLTALMLALTLGAVASPATADGPEVFVTVTTENATPASGTTVATLGGGSFSPPTPNACEFACRRCFVTYVTYKIWTVLADLVVWKFRYRWCADEELVYSLTQSESLEYVGPVMRVGGSLQGYVGPRPGETVRALYDGRTFQYCPVTGPTGTNCLWEYHPKIDFYFLPGLPGAILNFSRLT